MQNIYNCVIIILIFEHFDDTVDFDERYVIRDEFEIVELK